MPRLCIDCLLAEVPCSASHLLTASARTVLSALRGPRDRSRPRATVNTSGALKELCEF